jgi:hypothetical protein
MNLYASINVFTKELEQAQIPYAIIGGLAVFAYGGERATFDVDLLIHGDHKDSIKNLATKLNLRVAHESKEVLQLSGAMQIDIIFANREHSQKMIHNKRTIKTLPYPVVSPEDLIGLKIQAFTGDRSREYIDKGDILTLIRLLPEMDFNKIKEYADIFNVWNEILELKKHK